MRCVTCKSDNVKKLSAVIAQGSKEVNLGHGFLGIGASKQGLGIGGAKGKSTGTIKDTLATKLENRIPKRPSKLYTISLVILGISMLGNSDRILNEGRFFDAIFFIALMIIIFYLRKKSFKKYEDLYEKFTRMWYCFKCNGITIQGKLKKK
jgi:hypothetical protein